MNPEAVEDASNDVMKIILDSKLALFTSDKVRLSKDYNILTKLYYFHEKKYLLNFFFQFLASASGAAFKSLAVVGEKVILNHYGPDQEKWLKAIALALVHNDKDTRLTASLVVKRLANVLGGQETMEKLAADINEIVWQGLDLNPDESNEQLKVANVTIGIFYFHEILFSTYKSIFDFTNKIISILIF